MRQAAYEENLLQDSNNTHVQDEDHNIQFQHPDEDNEPPVNDTNHPLLSHVSSFTYPET